MNQKHCRGCPHLDFNAMTDEMYCKLKDFELIRLRWHKQRPDWCPLVKQKEGRMKIGDRVYVQGQIDEIRKDTVIIRNNGGYFGTIPSEVITGELPSAQPEQKIGYWIPVHPLQADDEGAYLCSNCKTGDWDIKPTDKFCKFCGAKMQGVKKE